MAVSRRVCGLLLQGLLVFGVCHGVAADELPTETILFQGFEGVVEDTWSYTAVPGPGGLIEVVGSRSYNGAHSLRLRGSYYENADPHVVFSNVMLTAHANVRLSIAFSASGPDRNDNLWLDLSYDNGATWNGEGSVRLVSGFNNAEIPFGETRTEDPVTVPSNPWIVEIPGAATQIMVRIRFDERSDANGELDSYFIDDMHLFHIPAGQPPVIRALPACTGWAGHPLEFWVVADDIDHDAITLWAEELPPGAAFDPVVGAGVVSNLFSYVPVPAHADMVFTARFVAADGQYEHRRSVEIAVRDKVINFNRERAIIAEGAPAYSVWASISRAVNATVHVAVAGSAILGTDYTLSSTTLVFEAGGVATQAVEIVVVDDHLPEGLENIEFTLVAPSNALIGETNRFVLSIRDNDSFSVVSANLSSGSGQYYRDPGIRILEGLRPDIVAIQEFKVTNALGRREFVDLHFGPEFEYYVGTGSLPCGIISRWPILDAGEWLDPIVGGREFAWATIALPGSRKLNVVSVHFYASGSASDREQEARLLTNYIHEAGFDNEDFLVICGDLNTQHRGEAALQVLTNVVSDVLQPADQHGVRETNANRNKPYDYVLPDTRLDQRHLPVRLEGCEFPDGLVFDTRLWTNTPPPFPAEPGDSGVDFMAHMAVLKVFSIEPFVRVATIAGPHGNITPTNPIAPAGADFTFTIEPDPYYRMVELRTNDMPVSGAFDGGPIVFTWSNLVEHAILESVFAPNLTSQGTPEWWLAEHGWTNDFEAAAWADPDEDGIPTWEEYLAGTDPLDPHSRFALIAGESAETSARTIRWLSVSNRFYTVLRSTNLLSGFEAVAQDIPATPPVNTYEDALHPSGVLIYTIEIQ